MLASQCGQLFATPWTIAGQSSMSMEFSRQKYWWVSEWMKATQSCLTLCDRTGYTAHGILQTRTLEWVAYPFSRGTSQPRKSNQGLLHCRQILYQLRYEERVAIPFSKGSSWSRDRTWVSCTAGRIFTIWATKEGPCTTLTRTISLWWTLCKISVYPVSWKCTWLSHPLLIDRQLSGFLRVYLLNYNL